MPYTIRLPIEAGRAVLPRHVYRALQANLYRWLAAADPDLAAALHARPVRKPFTISPLTITDGATWRFRVTLLVDDLWEPLQAGLQVRPALDLSGSALPVVQTGVQVHHRTYQRLLSEAESRARIVVCFLSPTSFKAGALDYPVPEPATVFRSWLSRWNDFAPPEMRFSLSLLDVTRACMAIADYELHTEVVDLGKGKIVGFVGRVGFSIKGAEKLSRSIVRRLNCLADYASYCGTGHKTTHGMGQTRRIRR